MDKTGKVKIHFFVDNEYWACRYLFHVPRAGDEVRFHDEKYFTVKRLIWPMDEESNRHERCNIELIEAT